MDLGTWLQESNKICPPCQSGASSSSHMINVSPSESLRKAYKKLHEGGGWIYKHCQRAFEWGGGVYHSVHARVRGNRYEAGKVYNTQANVDSAIGNEMSWLE